MGLVLEMMWLQFRPEVFAEEFDSVSLISFTPHSHPDQVNVIRHQAISGTEDSLASGGVEHDFAKMGVKSFVQQSNAEHGDGHGPMNHGVALVVFARETLQVKAPIRA